MITRPLAPALRATTIGRFIPTLPIRQFSATPDSKIKNRLYTPVRNEGDFETYKLLSTSSRIPFLTFWTASYCSTCRAVSPVLTELIESGVGEQEGGVSFCEVEYDSPDIMQSGLGMTYQITSMPTLLSFDRGEAQTITKLTDPAKLKDREFMKEWIRTEARRGGDGGGGGGFIGKGIFGGLFGSKG